MNGRPDRLSIRIDELHVAVPSAEFGYVREALSERGFAIYDLGADPRRSGIVVHAEKLIELDVARALLQHIRREAGGSADPARLDSLPLEAEVDTLAAVVRYVHARVKAEQTAQSDGKASQWLKVFSTRMVQTGYELHVLDEPDADHQLELLADVTPLLRNTITIAPRPGWEGYL